MVKGNQPFTRWNLLSWHAREFDEAASQHSEDKLSTVGGNPESTLDPEIPASRASFGYTSSSSMKAAVTPVVNVSHQNLSVSAASTAFFSTRPVMTEVVDVRPITWPSVGPMQQSLSIPAPLWQDVEILPDDISIAQTAAGTDWILGRGSYGCQRLLIDT